MSNDDGENRINRGIYGDQDVWWEPRLEISFYTSARSQLRRQDDG